jgi:hypothetical protein
MAVDRKQKPSWAHVIAAHAGLTAISTFDETTDQ